MYCKRCFQDLTGVTDSRCPKCGLAFDPARPKTFLARRFPTAGGVVLQIIGTTIVAVLVAYVVAFHQMARTSGH